MHYPRTYLLCMNMLTEIMENEVRRIFIQGLKIAKKALPLTNIMYADDILIFGRAETREIGRIRELFNAFCQISGQQISPPKSKIWLSSSAPPDVVTRTAYVWRHNCFC